MEEKTVENLVAELMQLKVEDQKVFTANVIRVVNKIILTGISATIPVVIQTLEFDEDGALGAYRLPCKSSIISISVEVELSVSVKVPGFIRSPNSFCGIDNTEPLT